MDWPRDFFVMHLGAACALAVAALLDGKFILTGCYMVSVLLLLVGVYRARNQSTASGARMPCAE